MSARNTLAAKAERRRQRTIKRIKAMRLVSRELAHGVCSGGCNRRRMLVLPARLCERCLIVASWVLAERHVDALAEEKAVV